MERLENVCGKSENISIHKFNRAENPRRNCRVQGRRRVFYFARRGGNRQIHRHIVGKIFGVGIRIFRGKNNFVGVNGKIFRGNIDEGSDGIPAKNSCANLQSRNFERRIVDADIRFGSIAGRIFLEGRAARHVRDNFPADIFDLRGVRRLVDGDNFAGDVADYADFVVADW